MKAIIIVLVISLAGLITPSNVSAEWVVNVTKKRGKKTDCGLRYRNIYHQIGGNMETIVCKGRGKNECPDPVHQYGSIMLKSVENAVKAGNISGKIINNELLSVVMYYNGSYDTSTEEMGYDAKVYFFESVEEMSDFLEGIGL